ncbi:MAG TPA: hypothetical protein VJK54_09475, partial [Chthoniobacterales bacterium]|nr:hypothetical protein [Chthoniobacterales bacterium]
MKKIILFIIFTTSANCSLLFAQTDNQVTGCRLQSLSREQGMGNGVQATRSREQDTDNREQVRKKSKKTLPLEYQIRQRAKVTTNYELPTANCNSQGNDLDCYLMMDPGELKNIEEGIENLKGGFGFSGKTAVVKTTAMGSPVGSSSSSAMILGKGGVEATAALTTEESAESSQGNNLILSDWCLQSKADYQAKAAEAKDAGKNDLSRGYLEAATTLGLAADQYRQSIHYKSSEGSAQITILKKSGKSLQSKAEYQSKAAEAKDSGRNSIAVSYSEAAAASELAAEQFKQAVKIHDDNIIIDHGDSFEDLGSSLQAKADYQAKAAKVTDSGKNALATVYLEAVTISELAAEQFKQAVTACITKEYNNLEKSLNVGRALQAKADYKVKAVEALEKVAAAEEQGNQHLAALWRKIETQCQAAVGYHLKAAEAQAVENKTEYVRCNKAAISAENSGDGLKESINAFAKAAEAEIKGNQSLAALWRKIETQCQFTAEYHLKAAEAQSVKNKAEYVRCNKAATSAKNSGSRLKEAINALEKVAAAEERGNKPLAALWAKIATQYQEAAEHAQKSVEAKLSGNAEEADRLEEIAFAKLKASLAMGQTIAAKGASETALDQASCSESNAWNRVALKLEQASKSWNKVSETLTRGNQELASLWKKAAEKEGASAEECKQIASAFAEEDEIKAERLDKTSWIAFHLSNADGWLAESEEALEKGNQDIAEFWRQAAMKAQEAAEHWKQAVQAHSSGNTEDGEHWENIARVLGGHYEGIGGSAVCLSKVAEYLTNATEASNKGKQQIATLWITGAEQMKISSEYEIKIAQAYKLKSEENDDDRWDNIVKFFWHYSTCLESTVKSLEQATAATANENKPLAELWSKMAAQHQELVEYYQKTAEAKLSENTAVADCWEKITSSVESSSALLYLAAEALEKTAEATAKGSKSLAEFWSKTVTQYQESAEHYRKTAEAKLNGNDAEANRLNKVASFANDSAYQLESAAEALEKATTATAKGNQPLAELWSKTAAQYQEVVEHYQKTAEAKLNGNDAEADRWKEIADFVKETAWRLQLAARVLEKAVEAIANENQPLAELWSKTAAQHQEFAEHYRKTVEVKLNKHDVEADHREVIVHSAKDIICSLESAVEALEKASRATAKGNQPLAELWSKTAAQYQEVIEHYRKTTEAKLNGNHEEVNRLYEIGFSANCSAYRLASAARALEKATRATDKGNQPLAELWSKTATQHQEAAEYYRKAAEAELSWKD